MINYEKLESDICEANRAALNARFAEDGCTCNYDTPVIKLERADRSKLAAMDVRIEPVGERMWRGWYFVFVELWGQGNRRTLMAEVAAKSLKSNGWEAMVYYQID